MENNMEKINIGGQEMSPEEVAQYIEKAKTLEEKIKRLEEVSKQIVGNNVLVENPTQFITTLMDNLSNKLINTPEGKEILKKMYEEAFGKQQIDENFIKELKDVFGEEQTQKLLEILNREKESLRTEYEAKLKQLEKKLEEEKHKELTKMVEKELKILEKKYSIPDILIPVLTDLYLQDEKGRSMLEIYEQEILPKLTPQFSSKEQQPSPQDVAKATKEALDKLTQEGGASGKAVPLEDQEEVSVEGLLRLYEKLGVKMDKNSLPEHFRKLLK